MDSQIPIVQNGENRLISAVNAAGTQKLEFVYDYMGRRVEKKVYSITTTPEGATLQLSTHHRFVYDGFKQIEKLNALADNAIINKFVWQPETFMNLDVPLSVSAVNSELATVNYYYFTDANKNIGQLMDASGNIVAKYEYSPFGKIVSADGTFARTNPFRFSSEYQDDETYTPSNDWGGLVYYNFRYYSPALGRWTNRDPIHEEGGKNIYIQINNNPICKYDHLGLACGDFGNISDVIDPKTGKTIGDMLDELQNDINKLSKELDKMNKFDKVKAVKKLIKSLNFF